MPLSCGSRPEADEVPEPDQLQHGLFGVVAVLQGELRGSGRLCQNLASLLRCLYCLHSGCPVLVNVVCSDGCGGEPEHACWTFEAEKRTEMLNFSRFAKEGYLIRNWSKQLELKARAVFIYLYKSEDIAPKNVHSSPETYEIDKIIAETDKNPSFIQRVLFIII